MGILPKYMTTAITCLSPKLIHNPHIDQDIVVPCRHCTQCLNTKSTILADRCTSEASAHKYNFFVTLTYSDDNIPQIAYQRSTAGTSSITDDAVLIDLIDKCPRNSTYNQILSTQRIKSIGAYGLLEKKQKTYIHGISKNTSKTIFTFSKEDVQKYIKRLRMQIFRQTGEYIRYVCVSEYGPNTYRPHYHLIFHFDSPQTLSVFRKYSITSWKLGSVDSQLSKGYCASYVSSYINSFTSIPNLLQIKYFKPFCTHSRYFGIDYLRSQRASVYDNSTQLFNGFNVSYPNDMVTVRATHNVKSTFFPKVYRYNELDTFSLFQLYTLYYKALRFSEGVIESPTVMSRLINRPLFHREYTLLQLSPNWETNPRLVSRVYNAFLTSYHFYTFVCDGKFNLITPRFELIREFYSKLELHRMNNFYISLSSYAQKTFGTDKYKNLALFYPLDRSYSFSEYLRRLKESDIYKDVKFVSDSIAESKIKHKRLNDLNNALNYNINNLT